MQTTITLPSPLFSHFDGTGRVNKTVYPDVEHYWADLIDAYHREMNALANAGCRYIQIDETTVIRLCDPSYADILRKRGVDPAAQLEEWASILRKVAEGKPDGVTLAMHICRGNGPGGSYISEGSYEPIARALFADVPFDTYLLEFDTERAGGFEPLRHVPAGKTVVLGLISTKKPALENPERLASRVREAERFVALEDLAISPKCGFSSDVIDRPLGVEDQKRKLDLLVKAARMIWD